MLQSYQATIKNNHIHWLETPPQIEENADVLVMVLPKQWKTPTQVSPIKKVNSKKKDTIKRQPPIELRGMGHEVADIVNVPEFEEMWNTDDNFDYS